MHRRGRLMRLVKPELGNLFSRERRMLRPTVDAAVEIVHTLLKDMGGLNPPAGLAARTIERIEREEMQSDE
jgi:hypothetical protein